MKTEINATYGSYQTPCTVFVYDGWYCVEGSCNVNHATFEDDVLVDGVDIEELADDDTATSQTPIESLDELEAFIDQDEIETLASIQLDINIESSNQAMIDGKGKELARMLRKLADKIESSESDDSGLILDLNGNHAGDFDLIFEMTAELVKP